MRASTTAVLFTALALVGGFYFFVENGEPPAHEGRLRPSPVLPRFAADDVLRLDLEVAELGATRTLSIVRTEPEGTLRLEGAVEDRADSALVARLFEALARLERREPQADYGESALGLAPPQLRASISLRQGPRVELLLGHESLDARSVHARVSGRPEAFLVPEATAALLRVAPDSLRSTTLVALPREQIETITLAGRGTELSFRKLDGRWLLLAAGAPPRDASAAAPAAEVPADGERVEGLLDDLFATRIGAFVLRDEGARRGLTPPHARITLESPAGRETVMLGAPATDTGTLYARVADRASDFVIPDRFSGRIDWRAEGWRSQALFHAATADVRELKIAPLREGAGESFALKASATTTGTAYTFDEQPPREADAEAVRSLLEDLRAARIVRIVAEQPKDLANFGLDGRAPGLRVSVAAEGLLEELCVGADGPTEGFVYAKRPRESAVLEIRLAGVERLREARELLASRTISSRSAAALVKLSVWRAPRIAAAGPQPKTAPRLFVRLPQGGYTTPEGLPDEESLGAAIAVVSEVRASRRLRRPAEVGPQGLADPWLGYTALFETESGSARLTLAVGRATDRGDYAASLHVVESGAPEGSAQLHYFALPAEAVATLDRDHVRPQGQAPDPPKEGER